MRARHVLLALPLTLCLGETDQKNGVGNGDTDGHDRAHEGLDVQRSLRGEQHQNDAAEHRWNCEDDGQREAQRLEVPGQQQEDDSHSQQQTNSEPGH